MLSNPPSRRFDAQDTGEEGRRRQRLEVGEGVSHCVRCGWSRLPGWVTVCDVDLLQRRLSFFFPIVVDWTIHFTETSSTPLLTKCMVLRCWSLLSANLACFLFPCKLPELHLQYEYQGNFENGRTRSWLHKDMTKKRHRCKALFKWTLTRRPRSSQSWAYNGPMMLREHLSIP